jgi:hypothetical protein
MNRMGKGEEIADLDLTRAEHAKASSGKVLRKTVLVEEPKRNRTGVYEQVHPLLARPCQVKGRAEQGAARPEGLRLAQREDLARRADQISSCILVMLATVTSMPRRCPSV